MYYNIRIYCTPLEDACKHFLRNFERKNQKNTFLKGTEGLEEKERVWSKDSGQQKKPDNLHKKSGDTIVEIVQWGQRCRNPVKKMHLTKENARQMNWLAKKVEKIQKRT